MVEYTQAGRPAQVTTPLGTDVLLLAGFSAKEAVSRLFEFRIDLLAAPEAPVPFERLLGQEMTVEFTAPDGNTRWFSGMVHQFTREGQGDNFVSYTAELAPTLWRLTQNVRSRIFQQMTVPKILETVLDGMDVVFELTGQYAAHNYCVQYEESDFAFASRLMEEEGIHYYFTHSAEGHRLLVKDDSSTNPALPHQPTVRFDATEGVVREQGRIRRWRKSQRLCVGSYTLRDHCFEMPDKDTMASEPITEDIMAGTVSHRLDAGNAQALRMHEFPGGFVHRFDGIDPSGGEQPAALEGLFTDNQRTAKIRMQQEAADAIVIEGVSDRGTLTPGFHFSLEGHEDGDGDYLITGVEQRVTLPDYRTTSDQVGEYENAFTCIPAAMPYRPKRVTPRPVAHGMQTATVVGVGNEEIFTDKYGRVKVKFHWYQNDGSEANSCWLRVAHAWAGGNWGAITVPRVGHEVVIGFCNGDPDAPLVVGSVYNADRIPPFGLPENATLSGFKTQSRDGDSANYSGIAFEDHLGSEYVRLHSERDLISSAENSHHHTVPNTHRQAVGRSKITTVGQLPGGSSGSGSGGDAGDSSHWSTPEIADELGMSFAFVAGAELAVTVGLTGDVVIGTHARTIINPGGLMYLAGPQYVALATGAVGVLAAGATALAIGYETDASATEIAEDALWASLATTALFAGGGAHATFGAETALTYGPRTECVHGSHFDYHGKIPDDSIWAAAAAPVTLLSIAYGAVSVAAGITPAMVDDDDDAIITGLALTDIQALMLNALVWAEKLLYDSQSAAMKTAEAADEVTRVEEIMVACNSPEWFAAIEQAVNYKIQQATNLVQLGAATAISSANAATAAQLAALSSQAVKTVNGDCTVNANNISLATMASANPFIGSSINLTAPGAIGTVRVSGGALAELQSGVGTVTVQPAGATGANVISQCGVTGTLLLRRVADTGDGQIEINPEGITISTLATPITLRAGDSQIQITPEAIMISAPTVLIGGEEAINLIVDDTALSIDAEGLDALATAASLETELANEEAGIEDDEEYAEMNLDVGLNSID